MFSNEAIISRINADLANDLGNPRGANIAMLGVLAAATDLFDPEFLIAQINDYFEAKGKKVPANEACFRKGMEAV